MLSTVLANQIRTQGSAAQFIVLHDTDHREVGVQEFMARPELTQILAETGVKRLFLEIPAFMQPQVSSFQQGTQTSEQLRAAFWEHRSSWFHLGTNEQKARYADSQVQLIEQATHHGIQVYCYDQVSQHPQAPAHRQHQQAFLPTNPSLKNSPRTLRF